MRRSEAKSGHIFWPYRPPFLAATAVPPKTQVIKNRRHVRAIGKMMVRNINIATRATLCFTAITLLLIVLAVFAIIQMGEIRKAEQEVEADWMPSSLQAGLIKAGILRLRLESLRASSALDPQGFKSVLESFPKYREERSKTVSDVAREVDRNLVNIRDLSIQTSTGASQSATASGEVSRLAVGLNKRVARFSL